MSELCEIMVFAESRAEFLAVRYNKNTVQSDHEQDAMHCQKETCKKIIRKGGEYVLTLKKNNEKLENFATVESRSH